MSKHLSREFVLEITFLAILSEENAQLYCRQVKLELLANSILMFFSCFFMQAVLCSGCSAMVSLFVKATF